MKKQTQVFMTPRDEAALSTALVSAYERVVFVDDNVWESPDPPERNSITECRSPFVFICNKTIVPHLPIVQRRDGRYEGPISGVVIQFVRSRQEETTLLSGRIAVGFREDAEDAVHRLMGEFISGVWRILRKVGTDKLLAVNPSSGEIINASVKGYFVGSDAASWCLSGEGRFLKDRSTDNYFRPRQAIPA